VRDAGDWLLDHCPPEYRGYPVLRRHPRVLAVFAAAHVAAMKRGTTDGLARIRVALTDEAPTTVRDAVAALEAEQARLELLERSVAAVRFALESAEVPPRSGGAAIGEP
jgi:hypothetical protein